MDTEQLPAVASLLTAAPQHPWLTFTLSYFLRTLSVLTLKRLWLSPQEMFGHILNMANQVPSYESPISSPLWPPYRLPATPLTHFQTFSLSDPFIFTQRNVYLCKYLTHQTTYGCGLLDSLLPSRNSHPWPHLTLRIGLFLTLSLIFRSFHFQNFWVSDLLTFIYRKKSSTQQICGTSFL